MPRRSKSEVSNEILKFKIVLLSFAGMTCNKSRPYDFAPGISSRSFFKKSFCFFSVMCSLH